MKFKSKILINNDDHYYRYEPTTGPDNICPAGWENNYGCGYYLAVEQNSEIYCVRGGGIMQSRETDPTDPRMYRWDQTPGVPYPWCKDSMEQE